ncbi:GPI ethanolamine phosphate transferase 2-like isoform X1 [Chenopodium quinoa]|uniref:GPI ethanolamine phosphate transferase 2 C-terminal domain-containing protein n=1 Tax=Chenopodium quinoa TaxID=63459 RepID=A0A803KX98_CHEQI|nr:GPI ethanolamine phosphate transferase 2-like isoform X1 [Chenopodium quinoa]XP_021713996.1 GPI ethanolamine phosphate transferase 2-like isoform X1 [Chenopodium quinoa]
MSSISCTKLTIWTIFAMVLQIAGLYLFVLGFFPVKPALSGASGPESYRPPENDSFEDFNVSSMNSDDLRSLYLELSEVPPLYRRLILMVVDGLPAEFVLGKDGEPPTKAFVDAMPYTHSLLANNMAIGYHAKAAPPTVTMPRLKAMVSGAIGGFLDVALNFNTQAFLDDNLLGQFFRIGWNMTMFGDETWLKLFPKLFTRQDGVSSFFVKDTIVVDLNVSRHLPEELYQDDWHLMILHYLGVDHVGHIGGRKSVLMPPKLREMDDVVKMIHLNSVLSSDSKQGDTLLLLVSDHGMTESGNHGGSSYEETDSLALFIGASSKAPRDDVSAIQDTMNQVDIPPTLALLFGVPIPKNNVGVANVDCLLSLPDGKLLRALELNSWQLLRLLKAQLPGLSCVSLDSGYHVDTRWPKVSQCSGTTEEMFCCLYSKAAALHTFWNSTASSSDGGNHYNTVTAYHDFLMTASEWLTRKVTDKPIGQLALGILAMVTSSLVFLRLLFCLRRDECLKGNQGFKDMKISMHNWSLEEIYVVAVIVILVVSMGSSSMVEEEQYIWHFLTSTLFWILIRKMIKSFPVGERDRLNKSNYHSCFSQVCPILVMLICGRIIRAWHQGGVNWTHLPDISKWLEQGGSNKKKAIRVVSCILVTSLSLFSFSRSRLNRVFRNLLQFFFLLSGCLVLQHIMIYQDNMLLVSGHGATFMAQIIYAVLSIATGFTVLASPWLSLVSICKDSTSYSQLAGSHSVKNQMIHMSKGFKESIYLIGWAYMISWSLLQLLLQQPINSMPVFLLLLQISAAMMYFFNDGTYRKPWVEVAILYFIGMTGHFGLGNSNTLATIDVAGAFIGISSHSTILSGILMFCITYASPISVLLSLMIYISLKDECVNGLDHTMEFGQLLKSELAIPFLVPLGINSVLLSAYTIVLLQMRNHLFIWSVFSPKYLYICATTACVYMGGSIVAATVLYTSLVYTLSRKRIVSVRNSTKRSD